MSGKTSYGLLFWLIYLCINLAAGVYEVSAQNQDSSDTLSVILEPISVEATHSSVTLDDASMSVSTLRRSPEEVASRRAATMDEITFTLPGIWINNRETNALGERMTVRGMGWRSQFGVRGIQVVLDDIPLTVADGQTILNMIDPAMVHSIELLRGPSATFWGNSSGGVLFLRTRPGSEAPAFRYRSYYGSYQTMKHEVQLSTQASGVQWNGYGSYYRSDGFREHSQSELIRGGLSAGLNLGENTRLDFRAAYAGMPYAEHPGSLPRQVAEESPRAARQLFADANAGKTFDQLMGGASLYQSFDAGLLTVTAHGTWRDFANPLPFAYITVDRLAGGTRATFDVDDLPFQLQVGGELKWQRDDRLETNFNEADPGQPGEIVEFDQLEGVGNQALFSHLVIPWGKFAVSAGLRADRMRFSADDYLEGEQGSRVFTTLNPSIGLTYKFTGSRIFANLSTSFESPTTTEFKNRPGGATGFNRNLEPERTVGLETGVRGVIGDGRFDYDVTLFTMRVEDLIVPFDEDEQGRVYYRNEGSTRHAGLESRFSWRPVDQLSLEWMYTYLNVEFTDGAFEGNQVPGVTPHRFSAISTLNLGDHRVSLEGEWVGQYYTDSDNTAHNESYLLVNGRWLFDGVSFEEVTIQPFLSVNNVLDARYNSSVSINAFGSRYYEPASGRNVQGGLSIHFR